LIVANLARKRGYFELDFRKLWADNGELCSAIRSVEGQVTVLYLKIYRNTVVVLVSAARE
jgi:hypothetical protein